MNALGTPRDQRHLPRVDAAFAAAIGLFAAFMPTDENFIAYSVEGALMRTFSALLASFLRTAVSTRDVRALAGACHPESPPHDRTLHEVPAEARPARSRVV